MNNTTSTTEDPAILVQYYNDEMASLLTPITIIIALLMASGLTGNLMVCFYYTFKTKLVPTSVFIINLAVYDLIVCLFGMPTEIVDIVKFYTFTNSAACKFLRFLEFFSAIASMLMLLVIALDRYKHVKFATGKQWTLRESKIRCGIVAGLALFLSWPAAITNDAVPIPVANDKGLDLRGSDCTTIKAKSYEPYILAFNGFHLLVFIISCIVLIFLYGTIGRTIYLHRKRLTDHKKSVRFSPSNKSAMSTSDPDTQFSTISDNGDSKPAGETAGDVRYKQQPKENGTTNAIRNSGVLEPSSGQKKVTFAKTTIERKDSFIDRETLKLTCLMISITVLFICSVLPYLSLVIWRAIEGKHEAKLMSGAKLVAFRFWSRSYLLNSSFNPWVYGIFNTRFRNYYYKLFCCKRNG